MVRLGTGAKRSPLHLAVLSGINQAFCSFVFISDYFIQIQLDELSSFHVA